MNHIKAGIVEAGELIRRYRVEAGLTQEELSEKAEISVRAVRNLEQGLVRRPRRGTLERLAVALGLEHDKRAQFIEAAGGSAASSFSGQLSTVDVVAKSQVWGCLAELLEQIPIQHGATVLVVQMIRCGHAIRRCQ